MVSPLLLHDAGRIRRLNLTVPFTFRRLEEGLEGGGIKGALRRLQEGFKGPDLREGFRKHEGLEAGFKGASRGLEGGLKGT